MPTYDLEEKYASVASDRHFKKHVPLSLSHLRSRRGRAKMQPCQVTFNGFVRTVLVELIHFFTLF